MAKINLDIGHALSREDQRQNRRNFVLLSQSSSSYVFLRKPRGEVLKKNKKPGETKNTRLRSRLPRGRHGWRGWLRQVKARKAPWAPRAFTALKRGIPNARCRSEDRVAACACFVRSWLKSANAGANASGRRQSACSILDRRSRRIAYSSQPVLPNLARALIA